MLESRSSRCASDADVMPKKSATNNTALTGGSQEKRVASGR